jgi:hypothetical protein
MPRVLHLIKDPSNRVAFDVLATQAQDPANRLSIVLMQRAAVLTEPLPGEVFRLAEGPEGRGVSPYRAIDHSGLLDLIFSADTVVSW